MYVRVHVRVRVHLHVLVRVFVRMRVRVHLSAFSLDIFMASSPELASCAQVEASTAGLDCGREADGEREASGRRCCCSSLTERNVIEHPPLTLSRRMR